MESLFTEENIKLFFILFGAGFITIFIMALTNKVVVFEDGGDLMITLGIIIAPIIGFLCLAFLEPSAPPPDYNMLSGSTAAIFVSAITVLTFIFCFVKTFTNSIASNGLAMGITIAIFRIISSFIIIFALLGFINRLTENNKSLGNAIIFIIIFTAIFGWVLKVLINGEKVARKRIETAQEAS
ncbi:uncharacterized protein METZ01_LOCUS399715 [marine metagenome]|uniref:Uncharacterized protein n=1 Tax=marine metagenome TaxID=408172 RepID=A0A382VLS4_9ZZZZ